jgi:hypothetical protein
MRLKRTKRMSACRSGSDFEDIEGLLEHMNPTVGVKKLMIAIKTCRLGE